MKKTTLFSLGGIVTAIIASICCIGPIIFLSLGISSIAAFSMFENYRGYFIGLTIIFLVFAFYMVYKNQNVKCEDESCKIDKSTKNKKIGLWIITAFTLLVIGVPYFDLMPHTSENKIINSNSSVILKISGMDCKSCAVGLENSLANIKGVRKAIVDFEKGNATIEYDNKNVSPNTFVELINKSGFKSEIEKGK